MVDLLIVSQPNYPVPAVADGAVALVIDRTLQKIPEFRVIGYSFWDEKMSSQVFEKKRYWHLKRDSVWFRLIKRVLIVLGIVDTFKKKFNLDTKKIDFLLGLKICVLLKKPKLIVIHATNLEWCYVIRKLFPNQLLAGYYHNSEIQHCDKNILTNAALELDAHIFVSNASREYFQVALPDLDITHKCYVVHNGTPIDDYYHKSKNNEKTKILFVGRLIPRKGVYELLNAISLLNIKDVKLLILGSDDFYGLGETDYIKSLKDFVASNGLSKLVFFAGYVPNQQMPKFYKDADILVFPSIESEGLPLTILEAQAHGIPVIASNVGGISEVITHGKNGFLLTTPGNVSEIHHYLDLLVEDRGLRCKMGRLGYEIVSREFSVESMASQFLKVSERIICRCDLSSN